MHYYLYQITNNLNGKIYVGVHRTQNFDDGYMGSGKVIRATIEKYGIENFTKDILETFEDSESMYAAEKELVTEEFLTKEDVYNLRRGGHGGFDHINGKQDANYYLIRSENGKKFNAKTIGPPAKWIKYGDENPFFGVKTKTNFSKNSELQKRACEIAASVESNNKRKLTLGRIKHQQGEKNSQFGNCWIYHELIGFKSIKKDLLPMYIDQGWYKGRKLIPR